MTGRIETYLHSDSITANKGGAMIRVTSQTDFAARTEDFISFCRIAAKYAYAANATTWADVATAFADIEAMRAGLQKSLCETISVEEILLLKL